MEREQPIEPGRGRVAVGGACVLALMIILIGGGHGAGIVGLLYIALLPELASRIGEPWVFAAVVGVITGVLALLVAGLVRRVAIRSSSLLMSVAGLIAAWWGWSTRVEAWGGFLYSSLPFGVLAIAQVAFVLGDLLCARPRCSQ